MDINADHAKTYGRYRDALRTERKLKPEVRQLAIDDLRAGITVAQLAEATGMTPEVFRRIARDNDIPVDARYAERAEKFRSRAATATEPRERPSQTSATPDWLDDFPAIAALTFAEAQERAKKLELDRPKWFVENRRDCTAAPEWINHAMLAANAADPEATPSIDAPATANPGRAQVD